MKMRVIHDRLRGNESREDTKRTQYWVTSTED